MTLAELQTYLRSHTATDTTILSDANTAFFVNGAIAKMQQAHLWRAQETISADTTYAANAASVAVPTGFIQERGVYIKNTASGAVASNLYFWVKRVDRTHWHEEAPTTTRTDTVFPQVAAPGSAEVDEYYYAIWDDLIFLYPTPSTAVTLVVDYYARIADLTTGDNVFTTTYAHVVRQGALAETYEFLHEDERAALHLQRFEQLLARAILDDKTIASGGGGSTRGV